ncbi:unnamed protein product [Aphanomyces euteiches]|uniref:MYND-type domain-containing protein n=1 Tax=Aphanomyces euteiches TaxID=100861 RepID=A0A6G0X3I3_9STRA|nr:hypothetical protein Ae201684_008834 [Aphanomyces euteiches]KAH9085993.1 hypothetical protein Ae201684P_005689 [Aphanomyces euteiches]KAH9134159.1 hypothetical protein AeRB84_019986 [Aphanomyces euteiches]
MADDKVQVEEYGADEDALNTVNYEEEDDEDVELEGGDMEVELGFLGDKQEHLGGPFGDWDGGKVGGKPVWLNPNLHAEIKCSKCAKNMSFLLQIYCPLDEPEHAFHRSLYVFVCRTNDCPQLGHARAFRCQLPQENPFYANHQDVDYRRREAVKPLKRCAVCNLKATFSCSACHVAQYCSKEHQKDHWKHVHKEDCPRCLSLEELIVTNSSELEVNGSKFVFPEYAIHIEREPESGIAQNETEEKMMRQFQQAQSTAGTDVFTDNSVIDISQKDLSALLGSTTTQDKTYLAFLTRVALDKDQVLRYCRWNEQDAVLWVHSEGKPDEIPACSICGEPRAFEFQVMPQLLYHLKLGGEQSIEALTAVNSKELDWGTLVVYTCPNSCRRVGTDDEVDFVEEFVWRQPPFEQVEHA